MKILALDLSSSHLNGMLFHTCKTGLLPVGAFSVELIDFDPFFFQKQGIDLAECYITMLLPEGSALYREKFFEKVHKKNINQIESLYKASLFPFEENGTHYETKIKLEKTGLLLKAGALKQESLQVFIDEIALLGITADQIGLWPEALAAATSYLLHETEPFLLFYQKNQTLFILEHAENKILFSSTLKLQMKNLLSHASAFEALKERYATKNLKTYLVVEHPLLIEQLSQLFNPKEDSAPLINESSRLLLWGSALLWGDKGLNFASKKFKLEKSAVKKVLCKLNLIQSITASAVLLFGAGFWVTQNIRLSSALQAIYPGEEVHIVSNSFLDRKMEELRLLATLEPWVPQIASPGELLAFLASHPALNMLDEKSKKNTSFQNFEYQLLQPSRAQIKFSCRFPTKEIQSIFEKDLKLRKINFQKNEYLQMTQYEFEIGKDFRI